MSPSILYAPSTTTMARSEEPRIRRSMAAKDSGSLWRNITRRHCAHWVPATMLECTSVSQTARSVEVNRNAITAAFARYPLVVITASSTP